MAADNASRMPGEAPGRVLRHSTRWRAGVMVVTVVTVTLAGACTGGAGPDPTAPSTSPVATSPTAITAPTSTGLASLATVSAGTASHYPEVPAAELAAIHDAITAINATAGGPVPRQRSELESLAAPDELAKQRACPTARTTLAFQPAYRDLRRAATGYLLPAFITIYTGDRITGTDLTTLHLWVIGGRARTGALCVS